MRIMITGGLGWTAESTVDLLSEAGHHLRLLDIDGPCCGSAEVVFGDVADPLVVKSAFDDVEAIVHFAVAVGKDDYHSPEVPFRTNVLGTYNVLKAASNSGTPVVLLSSAPVHLSLDEPPQGRWSSSPGGDHLYDLTKRLQEEMALDFSKTFDLPVTVLRAGHIVDSRLGSDPKGRSLDQLKYCKGGWVCRHDIARACSLAVTNPPSELRMLHLVGASPGYESYEVWRTEETLGFQLESRFTFIR